MEKSVGCFLGLVGRDGQTDRQTHTRTLREGSRQAALLAFPPVFVSSRLAGEHRCIWSCDQEMKAGVLADCLGGRDEGLRVRLESAERLCCTETSLDLQCAAAGGWRGVDRPFVSQHRHTGLS